MNSHKFASNVWMQEPQVVGGSQSEISEDTKRMWLMKCS